MKAFFKTGLTLVCGLLCTLSMTACSSGKSVNLGKPEEPTRTSRYEITDENFIDFKDKVEKFSSSFAEYSYAAYEGNDNFAVSPVSVFMALSLAAECAAGETHNEILAALGAKHEQLKQNFPLLYRSLFYENKNEGKTLSALIPTNSVWVNEGTQVNSSCIDALSGSYYCYSYSADFLNDNARANKAVRRFVKEKTNGLIDNDFKLNKNTLFALINTLYLKTVWNIDEELYFTRDKYEFKNADGSIKNTKLLQGNYFGGRVYREESFSTFFTSAYDGYKIKFIVPNEGRTVDDVFTRENLSKVNSLKDYGAVDAENKLRYSTRCLFPEYDCGYNEDVTSILNEKFGIDKLFKIPDEYAEGCDFSTLTSNESYCSEIPHVTKLTVDKTGIEGAAVTAVVADGTAIDPGEYETVHEDFIIDKAFGFIICDLNDTTLFSGVVNKL